MGISESLDTLVDAFNRGSLDVPGNFMTARTTYSLNGQAYETILATGQQATVSPDDPLIRMLARGAAGYRTAAKALQYALQRPLLVVESLGAPDASGVHTALVRIEGQLRGSDEPFVARAALRLLSVNGELTSVEVACADEDLARIAASRRT